MVRTTATSVFVVAALLAYRPADAFAPGISMRGMSMATTMAPQQRSMAPDGSGSAGAIRLLSPVRLQPVIGKDPRPRQHHNNHKNKDHRLDSSTESRYQQHNLDQESMSDFADAPWVPPDLLDSQPDVDLSSGSPDANSPGVGSPAEPLPESLRWASTNDSPWRRRARRGRMTVASAYEENEDDGEMGVQRDFESLPTMQHRRALIKREARVVRKQHSDRIRQQNALPIMDAVGMTAPLILIFGITLVQSLQ